MKEVEPGSQLRSIRQRGLIMGGITSALCLGGEYLNALGFDKHISYPLEGVLGGHVTDFAGPMLFVSLQRLLNDKGPRNVHVWKDAVIASACWMSYEFLQKIHPAPFWTFDVGDLAAYALGGIAVGLLETGLIKLQDRT